MSETDSDQRIHPLYILFVLFATKALDIFTTYITLTRGYGYEANPISRYLLDIGGFNMIILVGIIVIGIACVGFIWAQEVFESHVVPMSYKKGVRYFIYLCMATNILVVINNCYVIYLGSRN
jgi:hypothetical protein